MRNKIILVTITAIIIFLMTLAVYLYIDSCNLKKYLTAKDRELGIKISQEREAIKKSFEERYKTSVEFYEAIHRELETEKDKVRDMEKKIKEKAA